MVAQRRRSTPPHARSLARRQTTGAAQTALLGAQTPLQMSERRSGTADAPCGFRVRARARTHSTEWKNTSRAARALRAREGRVVKRLSPFFYPSIRRARKAPARGSLRILRCWRLYPPTIFLTRLRVAEAGGGRQPAGTVRRGTEPSTVKPGQRAHGAFTASGDWDSAADYI